MHFEIKRAHAHFTITACKRCENLVYWVSLNRCDTMVWKAGTGAVCCGDLGRGAQGVKKETPQASSKTGMGRTRRYSCNRVTHDAITRVNKTTTPTVDIKRYNVKWRIVITEIWYKSGNMGNLNQSHDFSAFGSGATTSEFRGGEQLSAPALKQNRPSR